MENLKEIRTAIENILNSLKSDDDFWMSTEHEEAEAEILTALKTVCGYDFEEDQESSDYFLKATIDEIWQYYLDTILPKLEMV
ncbi:MAG: hypothetical protein HEP71_34155 [Roseivirga sp.]|nr:hypothetical protein [Roseivirga sp.]